MTPANRCRFNDNFDPVTSHAMQAFIRIVREANPTRKQYVNIWGIRGAEEVFHADDLGVVNISLGNI